MDVIHQKDVAKRKESTDLLFQFLRTELETVGNVRFEEGTQADPWYNSCCDLILSRFCAREFKTFSITGVKINRIIRVHNRILRQRFDDKFQVILDNGDERFLENYRKLLEYLFCVFDTELPIGKKKLLKILEDGFKESENDKMQAKEDTILLSNSLSRCEGPKITFSQQQTKKEGTSISDYEPSRHGWLIIAKTFLGRCVKACDKRPINQSNYPTAHSVFRPRRNPQNVTNGDKNETCSSLELENCDCSLRQCEWFVFDHDLVVPEYVIELEYIALTNLTFKPN